jgi:beta-lactamase superfamily II metal-dependent hydrolase
MITIVLKRYQSVGVKQIDTVHAGAISFQLGRSQKNVLPNKRYRLTHYHLWNDH